MKYPRKHYVKLDEASQSALEEVCRYTLNKKSTLMRQYVRDGALRDAEKFRDQVERTRGLLTVLRTL